MTEEIKKTLRERIFMLSNDLENRFTYHAPNPEQIEKYKKEDCNIIQLFVSPAKKNKEYYELIEKSINSSS